MPDITKPKNFNSGSLSFSEVKTNQYGGKSVYIRYNDDKFRVQTPEMNLPYGLNEDVITDDATGEVKGHKYSVNLSFKGMDQDTPEGKKLQEFHRMLERVDDLVVKEGHKNALPWLRQKGASKEVIKALYNSQIKVSRDKDTQEPDGRYPDTIKSKIVFWDGVFKTEVYNESRELVDLKESLVKGTVGKALLECVGVWFAGGKFGVSWKVIQMRVKVPKSIQGYSFLSDSDDDEDDEQPMANETTVDNSSDDSASENEDGNALDNGVDSSEDDDDDDDEEEEAPPPPTPKKKKSKKKT